MISGGNATVFVNNMDQAVRFYTEGLGLKLTSRFGDHWATVNAGAFTIGLNPKSDKNAVPGTRGSIVIGLEVEVTIDAAWATLRSSGALEIGDVVRGDGGNFVNFKDPDGNELYLWETPKY